MRNRYATPNERITLEDGHSLVWHLGEGDFLPKPDGMELLDMDMQPVKSNIEGPAVVQVLFNKDKKEQERGACLIVRHNKGTCDCGACERQVATHGRMLLLPENELFKWMCHMIETMGTKHATLSGVSEDPEVIAFQFQACLAGDLLPWAGTKIPEQRPPSLSTFLDRYDVAHMARSDKEGEIINVTMTALQHECVDLRGLLDEAAATGEGNKSTMNPTLLTSLVAKCKAHSGEISEEDFKGFCEDSK